MRGNMGNSIIITKLQDRLHVFHMLENQIDRLFVEPKDTTDVYPNGTIVIGKIQKIVSGIHGAFLSLGSKVEYFMPLPKAGEHNVWLLNRTFDGSLKCGDEIVVQVIKQPIKSKQPAVDYHISLEGLYCVLDNSGKGIQVSSKLSVKKINELKSLFSLDFLDEDFYKIIIRTNAGFAENEQSVYEDYLVLADCYRRLESIYKSRVCYSVLYRPDAAYLKAVKDIPRNQYEEIITDLPDVYKALDRKGYTCVRFYEDASYPLCKLYSLETKQQELLHKKVWLKSGGFLVIEQGETLTAIDVNSGKNDKKTDVCYATNLEAVHQIFRQIRARNISGMILIDFINMKEASHLDILIQRVREEIKKDYVRCQYIDMTGLGLMEITREKKLPSLQELLQ